MGLGSKSDAKKDKTRVEKAEKVKKQKKNIAGKKAKKAIKEGKFHKLQSIQVKVCSLVLAGILISASLVAFTLINYTKDLVIDATYAKMLNVVNSYGILADSAEEENNNKVVDNAVYKDLFAGLQVEGSESSYCYVINVSGIIMYHPDESKIGGPNKNKVVTKVVSDLAKGRRPDVFCLEYEENGKQMYASYYITAAKSVVVMCAEGYELMEPIRGLTFSAAVFILVLMVLAYFLSLFVVKRFTKPLKQVTAIIDDTAQLKLRLPDNMDVLCSRKDESGVMSRAVKAMSKSIYEVVSHIEAANGSIETNMLHLETSSNQVHTLCTDNSATTEELAASTEEVTNMTNIMAGHMEEMRKQFEEINRETVESNTASEEIAGRAKAMQESTQEAIRQTREMYQQIKDKTALALNGLKSVERINELTGAIIDISDQTSLLSLNASIEAARAGEAGRGFAVVATEISNLAHRSLETVNDINAIIAEVNEAVTNITNSLEETSAFLERNVLADYDNFNQIGDQYQKDADTFKAGMTNISNEAAILNASIQEVTKAVERIKETIDETAIGINDIAGKTSEVVQATSDNYDLTGNTVNSVNELREIVEKFTF